MRTPVTSPANTCTVRFEAHAPTSAAVNVATVEPPLSAKVFAPAAASSATAR